MLEVEVGTCAMASFQTWRRDETRTQAVFGHSSGFGVYGTQGQHQCEVELDIRALVFLAERVHDVCIFATLKRSLSMTRYRDPRRGRSGHSSACVPFWRNASMISVFVFFSSLKRFLSMTWYRNSKRER